MADPQPPSAAELSQANWTPRCDSCGDELRQPGGLLFGPPSVDGVCHKRHLCLDCFGRTYAAAFPTLPAHPTTPATVGAGEVLDTPEKVLEAAALTVLCIRATPERENSAWFDARTRAAKEIRALRSRLPYPAASEQHGRAGDVVKWCACQEKHGELVPCAYHDEWRDRAVRLALSSAAPPADATLRSETEEWRREHLRMNWMTALEHAAALFDRWLAPRPAAATAVTLESDPRLWKMVRETADDLDSMADNLHGQMRQVEACYRKLRHAANEADAVARSAAATASGEVDVEALVAAVYRHKLNGKVGAGVAEAIRAYFAPASATPQEKP